MKRRIVGADEPAREFGFQPQVSASRFADETLYHGEYRHWLKVITDGLRRDDVGGRHAADA
jgi:benzoate/toluate 1,2-dioxygenase alpha subunit